MKQIGEEVVFSIALGMVLPLSVAVRVPVGVPMGVDRAVDVAMPVAVGAVERSMVPAAVVVTPAMMPAVVATMTMTMAVALGNPVTRDPDQGQQPVKADGNQQKGQRQHRRARGKFPDFLHDSRIPADSRTFRDYKSAGELPAGG